VKILAAICKIKLSCGYFSKIYRYKCASKYFLMFSVPRAKKKVENHCFKASTGNTKPEVSGRFVGLVSGDNPINYFLS